MLELPRAGTVIAERYRVEAAIGQGAMGSVWAAKDLRTERSVALKLIAPHEADSADAVLRFLNEARAAAKIDHPNVVSILDVGRVGQAPFIVMERLRGESLAQRIARGRLPAMEALDVVLGVCRGMAEAHREGVIHRDLKPANIYLSREDDRVVPKVVDFGVAKLGEKRVGDSITKTGVSIGTPAYAPPESFGAARAADVRTDIYAIGVVLYEAITGYLPYDAPDVVVLVRRIVEGNAPHLRARGADVPPGLDAIVRRAMSAEPEKRHASMGELIADLERIRHGPVPSTREVSRPVRRSWGRLAAAMLALFALVVGAGALALYALWPERAPPRVEADPLALAPEPAPPVDQVILPRVSPRRPSIDLVFGEGCDPMFDRMVAVAAGPHSVQVSGRGGAAFLAVQLGGEVPPLPFTVPIVHALARHRLTINVVDDSTAMYASDRAPRAGDVTVREWRPELAIMDVTFDAVSIEHIERQGSCRIDGRVQTRGTFYGEP